MKESYEIICEGTFVTRKGIFSLFSHSGIFAGVVKTIGPKIIYYALNNTMDRARCRNAAVQFLYEHMPLLQGVAIDQRLSREN